MSSNQISLRNELERDNKRSQYSNQIDLDFTCESGSLFLSILFDFSYVCTVQYFSNEIMDVLCVFCRSFHTRNQTVKPTTNIQVNEKSILRP